MSTMSDRINFGLSNSDKQISNVNGDLAIVGLNNAPTDIPLAKIEINNAGIVTYQDMQPLIASDGAPIAATMPGEWGQVYAAGRMY